MTTTSDQIDLWRQSPSEHQRLEFKEAKTQFDNRKLYDYCVALANECGGRLQKAGFSVNGLDTLVGYVNEATEASRALTKHPLDLLVLLQATFANSTPAVDIAQKVDSPETANSR